MGGSAGTSAPIAQTQGDMTNKAQGALQSYVGGSSQTPYAQNVLSNVGQGNTSISQALQQLSGSNQGAAGNQGGIDALYTDPQTAGLAAQSQVQSNPLYSGLFGKGGAEANAVGQLPGLTQNLADDRKALSGNDPSYGLQSSDLAAYGQASNNIGRQAAQQNQGISQALAARGLGSSNNGSAINSYAGAYGNQNEQLGQLQQQISQNRIQTAQGLAQARNQSDLANQQAQQGFATSLGQLGQTAYNNQMGSNLAGAQNNYNELAGSAASALNNQTAAQNQSNEQFAQQQATKKPSIGESIGDAAQGGLASAVGTLSGGGVTKVVDNVSKSAGSLLGMI